MTLRFYLKNGQDLVYTNARALEETDTYYIVWGYGTVRIADVLRSNVSVLIQEGQTEDLTRNPLCVSRNS
mgnify:CR=1 FL=1